VTERAVVEVDELHIVKGTMVSIDADGGGSDQVIILRIKPVSLDVDEFDLVIPDEAARAIIRGLHKALAL